MVFVGGGGAGGGGAGGGGAGGVGVGGVGEAGGVGVGPAAGRGVDATPPPPPQADKTRRQASTDATETIRITPLLLAEPDATQTCKYVAKIASEISDYLARSFIERWKRLYGDDRKALRPFIGRSRLLENSR